MPPTASDAYRAARCEAVFKKQGGDTQRIRLFNSFTSSICQFLKEQGSLRLGEIPVLGFFQDQETWLLATSQRVIWSRSGYKHQLKYIEIKGLGWSSGPNGETKRESAATIDQWIETDDGMKMTKHSSPWLFLLDLNGNRHEVLLEPGTPLIAIWDSISLMIRLEKIHPREFHLG